MLSECVVPCCVKSHLRSVFSLFQKLVNPTTDIFPRQKSLVEYAVFNSVTYCYLHTELIEPNRVIMVSNSESFAAYTVFTAYKINVVFTGLVNHEIVDESKLAPSMIAASAEDLINNIGRNRDFACVHCCNRLFNQTPLLIHSREIGQRQSRGIFCLCFG